MQNYPTITFIQFPDLFYKGLTPRCCLGAAYLYSWLVSDTNALAFVFDFVRGNLLPSLVISLCSSINLVVN